MLKGLSLKINANETVALVGESGCGKSTMVSLILRFYDVDHGRILLDGRDIRDYDMAQLRKAMGLVMQEPTLFNYTIAENILYGNQHAFNSEIIEAAKAANALEFIESPTTFGAFDDTAEALLREINLHKDELVRALPEGPAGLVNLQLAFEKLKKAEEEKGRFIAQEGDIDIRGAEKKNKALAKGFSRDCGIKGGKLSGGQKQRIAIARAIIRKPSILILDEATSALDEASQRLVQSALDNIMEGRTSIVIAHRLSTVEKCDRILVLEGGVLVEEGKFTELRSKQDGIFANLASGMQQKKEAAK